MIKIKRGEDPIKAYIYEAYRRLYSAAIDENGVLGDFDVLLNNSERDSRGRICIPYDDYYCPDSVQRYELAKVCELSYMYVGYHTKHKLTQREKNSVRSNVCLGCSPYSSITGFIRNHPNIANIVDVDHLKELERQ